MAGHPTRHFEIDAKNETFLREQYALAVRSGRPFCLVTLKLKGFRDYMHVGGEQRAQETLSAIYDSLERCLQEGESIARIGGCYFNALLYVPADMDLLHPRAHAFHFAVRDTAESQFGKRLYLGMGFYPVTDTSVSFFDAQHYADLSRVESLQSRYEDTHYEFYGLSYIDTKEKFARLEKLMWKSLDEGDFKLYLQPKVDLKTGEITHAEALMRWVHPELGMIPLTDFLEGFERNGFIRDVDLYLFEKGCAFLKKWLHDCGKKFTISFNLAAAYLENHSLETEYLASFHKYDLPKDCVRIELIESIMAEKRDELKEAAETLYRAGFTCAVDDFGSGYSSFSMLTTIPLSELKIDRSLFQNEQSETERILVWHIIEIAHDLDLTVVAEGVETQGYADYLREIGCDYIQGYFYYKPMPVEEFEQRFVKNGERVDLHTGKPILS